MRQLQAALLTWRMVRVEADTLGALAAACGLITLTLTPTLSLKLYPYPYPYP